MLKSVTSNLDTLKIESGKLGKAGNIKLQRLVLDANESLLLALFQVLKVFGEATCLISTDKMPSLQLVVRL